jgi:hypothetical protein
MTNDSATKCTTVETAADFLTVQTVMPFVELARQSRETRIWLDTIVWRHA